MRVGVVFLVGAVAQESGAVFSPGNSEIVSCNGVDCGDLRCQPPFKYVSPQEAGSCCPVCLSDDPSVQTPEDRSAFMNLNNNDGMNPNADMKSCASVVCPKLMCSEADRITTPEQGFDKETMCCSRCKGGGMAISLHDSADTE
mmetsp:Transcript_37299/g.89707  ORF Transcript_37299/g.89707 Transcript_37299/m.89707 type:complete len:143 (+) Transcript_37299:63-491(+)